MPGEAGDSLHAGELEQWLCGSDPLTGDHFHCVVVITNGKFVSVRMPRQTSGTMICGQEKGSSYKKVLKPFLSFFANLPFFDYLMGASCQECEEENCWMSCWLESRRWGYKDG